MRMQGMVAIVTGGSRGLGKAIALEYGREGAKVVILSRPTSPSGLSGSAIETAEVINSASGEALGIPCDVTNEAHVKNAVDRVMNDFGRIDVLVNCAGIILRADANGTADKDWRRMLSVKLPPRYLPARAPG